LGGVGWGGFVWGVVGGGGGEGFFCFVFFGGGRGGGWGGWGLFLGNQKKPRGQTRGPRRELRRDLRGRRLPLFLARGIDTASEKHTTAWNCPLQLTTILKKSRAGVGRCGRQKNLKRTRYGEEKGMRDRSVCHWKKERTHLRSLRSNSRKRETIPRFRVTERGTVQNLLSVKSAKRGAKKRRDNLFSPHEEATYWKKAGVRWTRHILEG